MITLDQKTPPEIEKQIAEKAKKRRKAMKITQQNLAEKSLVSLGSIRRFESTGKISLESLIKIAIALNCEDDFDSLFDKKFYTSIQEVIDENQR